MYQSNAMPLSNSCKCMLNSQHNMNQITKDQIQITKTRSIAQSQNSNKLLTSQMKHPDQVTQKTHVVGDRKAPLCFDYCLNNLCLTPNYIIVSSAFRYNMQSVLRLTRATARTKKFGPSLLAIYGKFLVIPVQCNRMPSIDFNTSIAKPKTLA